MKKLQTSHADHTELFYMKFLEEKGGTIAQLISQLGTGGFSGSIGKFFELSFEKNVDISGSF